jgi:hypothetical protein
MAHTNSSAATSAVNTLTDAHALAVLVFQMLSLVHLMLRDAVDKGEPELQERALAGDEAFPWVAHPENRRNPASRGLPRELVLTTPLRQLSHEALGPGLGTPSSRPRARHRGQRPCTTRPR